MNIATIRARTDRARKAAQARAKSKYANDARVVRHLEKNGQRLTLPSGRTAFVRDGMASIDGWLVGMSSGRLKRYETAGSRVSLSKADAASLRYVLTPSR